MKQHHYLNLINSIRRNRGLVGFLLMNRREAISGELPKEGLKSKAYCEGLWRYCICLDLWKLELYLAISITARLMLRRLSKPFGKVQLLAYWECYFGLLFCHGNT